MKFKELKEELLQNPEVRKEYYKKDIALDVAKMFIDARIKKGLTQQELAVRVDTQQPGIARIERGNYVPGLRFLEKVADAFGTHLIPPRFAFLDEQTTSIKGIATTGSYQPTAQVTTSYASGADFSIHPFTIGGNYDYNIISASQNYDATRMVTIV